MRLRGLRSCTGSEMEKKQMDIFQRKSVYLVLCPQEESWEQTTGFDKSLSARVEDVLIEVVVAYDIQSMEKQDIS